MATYTTEDGYEVWDYIPPKHPLAEVVDHLPEEKIVFARCLLAALDKHGKVSEKQTFWLDKLYNDFCTPKTQSEVADPKISENDFTSIVQLFQRVEEKLKKPTITLFIAGKEIALYKPWKYVGSLILVKTRDLDTHFGSINPQGVFEYTDQVYEGLIEGLCHFATNPAKVAARQGQLSGRCCFCYSLLNDKRSTEMGYGPTCAKNYELPWGKWTHNV
jgi:hypothetical protein